MTREEVSSIFKDATAEQISSILNLNSRDIGKSKDGMTKLQADLDAANAELKTARDSISALEKNKGDLDAVKKELEDFKAADEARKKAAAEAEARSALISRMDAVVGDRKFIHDRMKDLVADDFAAAIADKANIGKSDKEVFEAITKDKGFFASQNPAGGNMGGMNNIGGSDGNDNDLTDADYYAKIFNKNK